MKHQAIVSGYSKWEKGLTTFLCYIVDWRQRTTQFRTLSPSNTEPNCAAPFHFRCSSNDRYRSLLKRRLCVRTVDSGHYTRAQVHRVCCGCHWDVSNLLTDGRIDGPFVDWIDCEHELVNRPTVCHDLPGQRRKQNGLSVTINLIMAKRIWDNIYAMEWPIIIEAWHNVEPSSSLPAGQICFGKMARQILNVKKKHYNLAIKTMTKIVIPLMSYVNLSLYLYMYLYFKRLYPHPLL